MSYVGEKWLLTPTDLRSVTTCHEAIVARAAEIDATPRSVWNDSERATSDRIQAIKAELRMPVVATILYVVLLCAVASITVLSYLATESPKTRVGCTVLTVSLALVVTASLKPGWSMMVGRILRATTGLIFTLIITTFGLMVNSDAEVLTAVSNALMFSAIVVAVMAAVNYIAEGFYWRAQEKIKQQEGYMNILHQTLPLILFEAAAKREQIPRERTPTGDTIASVLHKLFGRASGRKFL